MNMNNYTIDDGGLDYEKALRLIKELDKWERGITACITQGGMAIYPRNDRQKKIMFNVCKKFGVEKPYNGSTAYERDIISLAR